MKFSIQPVLENEKVILYPLTEADFDVLYAVASDRKIWEQHPVKDRWKKDVFRTFFDDAIQSKGAFRIVDKESGTVAGSTRFYDYNEQDNSIQIGYTFYATRFWGTGLNPSVKKLMIDYAFRFVDKVYFQVGAMNYRSQVAVGRLGATKIAEQEAAYYPEEPKLNFLYQIRKEDWLAASGPGLAEIEIKKAATSHLEQVQAIAKQTFIESYSVVNTEENMKKYMEEKFSAASLFSELQNPGSQFYLAILHGKAIGYLKLNSGNAQTELKDEKAVEIERIYVLKEFQGKKVGQLLYDKAMAIAKEAQASYIWLGVWEENRKAIRFYRKNGFKAFDRHVFKLGDEEQTDIMMKRAL